MSSRHQIGAAKLQGEWSKASRNVSYGAATKEGRAADVHRSDRHLALKYYVVDDDIPIPEVRYAMISGRSYSTCGFMRTRSMKSTTKSCSTYLSQKLPHFRQTVRRIKCPFDLSSAPEYWVHRVLTGYRHSIQIGIAAVKTLASSSWMFCARRPYRYSQYRARACAEGRYGRRR